MTITGRDYTNAKDEVPAKGSPLFPLLGKPIIAGNLKGQRILPTDFSPKDLVLTLRLLDSSDKYVMASVADLANITGREVVIEGMPSGAEKRDALADATMYARHMRNLDYVNEPNRRGYWGGEEAAEARKLKLTDGEESSLIDAGFNPY